MKLEVGNLKVIAVTDPVETEVIDGRHRGRVDE